MYKDIPVNTLADAPLNLDKVGWVWFDLGNVLYEIDLPGAKARMEDLVRRAGRDIGKDYPIQLIYDMECGRVAPQDFMSEMHRYLGGAISEAEVLEAWNSVLVKPFPGVEQVVAGVASRYPVALLSNTNQLHYNHFLPQMAPAFGHMRHVFVSHDLGWRKPAEQIYTSAVDISGAKPEEILFLDDLADNVAMARKLGMQSVQIHSWQQVQDLAAQLAG